MDLRIRPAADADIPAIAGIYAHAVRHGTASFELEPPDEPEMARRRSALLAGILILVMPRLLNYIVAIYLIFIGVAGLIGKF